MTLSKKVPRRYILSSLGKIATSAVVAGIISGIVGYYTGKSAMAPPTEKTVTVTAEKTVTITASPTITVASTPHVLLPPGVNFSDWGVYPNYLRGTNITAAVQLIDSLIAVQNLLPQFEEETGINVDFVMLPEEELHQKVLIELSSGAGKYAIVMDDCMFVPQFVENEWIVPLNEFIDNSNLTYKPLFDLEDFLAKSIEIASWKGKIYGLPIYAETTVTIYRKDIFEEHSIRIPNSMKDLEKACEALREVLPKEVYPISLRGYPGEGANVYIWTGFLKAFGGNFFDENWEPIINNDAGVKATGFYAELLAKYGPPGSANYHWDDVQTALQQGKAMMAIEASDFVGRIEDPSQSLYAGKFGYSLVPEGPAGRFPSVFAFELMINAACPRKLQEAAWIFIVWATSKKLQLEAAISQRFSNVVRESVMNDPKYLQVWGAYADWIKAHTESLRNIASVDYRPRIPVWREVGNRIGIAISEVIAKAQLGADPYEQAKNALDAAADDIRQIMIKAGYLR